MTTQAGFVTLDVQVGRPGFGTECLVLRVDVVEAVAFDVVREGVVRLRVRFETDDAPLRADDVGLSFGCPDC